MSDSRHLRVAILTTATPKEVFATIRRLTSALPDAQADLERIGTPIVNTRPPRFSIRLPGGGSDSTVGWAGRVTTVANGTLIVARTNRTPVIWQGAIGVAVVLAGTLVNRREVLARGGQAALVIGLLLALPAISAWYRATHLSDRGRRGALILRDVLLSRLPNSSLVEIPQDGVVSIE